MESIDPANLDDVNKNFIKPGEYGAVLERLARRNLLAITSFIFGLDNDTPGVSRRTLDQLRQWPAGLPVFGQLTPFPSTPLYRPPKGGRPVYASQALDGFRPLSNGAHAAEDDRRAGAGRSQTSLDGFVQPGGDLARG